MRAVLLQDADRQHARPLRFLDRLHEIAGIQFLPVYGGLGRKGRGKQQDDEIHLDSSLSTCLARRTCGRANSKYSCLGTPASKQRLHRASYKPAAPTTIKSSLSTSR